MLTLNTLDALAALPVIAEAVNALPTSTDEPPLIAVLEAAERWPFLERIMPTEFLAVLRLPKGGRLTCVDGVGPSNVEVLRTAFLDPDTPAWGAPRRDRGLCGYVRFVARGAFL